MSRLLPHPLTSLALFVAWLLLVDEASPGALVFALLTALAVPVVTARFWPDRPRIRIGRALFEYAAVVAFDILVANVQVARRVLFTPRAALRPRFVVVPLSLKTPEAIAVLAGTITLTPGTVSCDVSGCGGWLLVHGLDVPDPERLVAEVKRRYERRLTEIFP